MMPGLKILGKIELPERPIRPEEYRHLLEEKLEKSSRETNERYGLDLLAEDGSLKIADHPEADADRQFVADQEKRWADEHHQTVEDWQRNREKNPALITEMAVTLALTELLQKRFIVAHASSYDDYYSGIDNVLIDRETGAVVCGFDEVLGFNGDDGGEKKDKKIKGALAHGGSTLKYGATIIDGKLERRELNHIPTFYLSLSKEELNSLLKDIKAGGAPTENMRQIGMKLVTSLEGQYQTTGEVVRDAALRHNLEQFAGSLQVMKEQLANKN
jgi:hypothetical protein